MKGAFTIAYAVPFEQGYPLINTHMLLVLDQVIRAAGLVKDAQWIAGMHEAAADELTKGRPWLLLGVLMDNTKANLSAMRILQERHPNWVLLGRQGHGLLLLLKDFANSKKTTWAAELFQTGVTIVNAINDSERIRTAVQQCQMRIYGKVRGKLARLAGNA
jgi:hypothetical protein